MSRNAFTPAAYSPATRRAIAAITKQVDWAEIHLPVKRGPHRLLELEHIVTFLGALKAIAEAHRNWDDLEAYSNRQVRYLPELDQTRLGIPPREEVA